MKGACSGGERRLLILLGVILIRMAHRSECQENDERTMDLLYTVMSVHNVL